MHTWNSADAKRRFSEVLHGTATEPQLLLLRGKPVGVVVSYESFTKNQEAAGEKSLSQWLADLSALHDVEGDMETPPRHDRVDPFGENWE